LLLGAVMFGFLWDHFNRPKKKIGRTPSTEVLMPKHTVSVVTTPSHIETPAQNYKPQVQVKEPVTERVKDTYESAKGTASHLYEQAKEKVSEWKDKAENTAVHLKDTAVHTAEHLKDSAVSLKDQALHKGEHLKDKAEAKADNLYNKVEEKAETVKENLKTAADVPKGPTIVPMAPPVVTETKETKKRLDVEDKDLTAFIPEAVARSTSDQQEVYVIETEGEHKVREREAVVQEVVHAVSTQLSILRIQLSV